MAIERQQAQNDPSAGSGSLLDDVRIVVAELRVAFRAILDALPRKVQTAAELRRVLSIDNKLASQVFKIAHADDPLQAAVLIPGLPSFERFLSAATSIGLSAETLSPASNGLVRFDQVVRRHAGNRTSFDSMLTGLSGREQEVLDLQHRRAAFHAMGHILGVQAQLLAFCSILYPTESGSFGLMTLRGLLRLRRIRSDTPVLLTIAHILGPGAPAAMNRRPLDGSMAGGNPAGLIVPLCSSPLPAVRTRSLPDGGLITELVEGGIGDLHAADFVIGFDYPDFGQHVPRRATSAEAMLFTGDIHIPAEDLIHDVLVPRRMPVMHSTAQMYPNRGGIRPMYDADNSEPLPTRVGEEVIENAASAYEHATPEHYARCVAWAAGQRGTALNEYRLHRRRLRFPVVNTLFRTRLFEPDTQPLI